MSELVKIEFFKGNLSAILNSTNRQHGQYFIAEDTHEMYIQLLDELIRISDCIILDTDVERDDILVPLNKFYLVKETGNFYYWDNEWVLLNEKACNLQDIYDQIDQLSTVITAKATIVSVAELPAVPEPNTWYAIREVI